MIFTVSATNAGPATATTVRLILKYPRTAGLQFQSGGSSGGCSELPERASKPLRKLICDRGPLASGASVPANIQFTATAPGAIPILGAVKSLGAGEADLDPTNNRLTANISVNR